MPNKSVWLRAHDLGASLSRWAEGARPPEPSSGTETNAARTGEEDSRLLEATSHLGCFKNLGQPSKECTNKEIGEILGKEAFSVVLFLVATPLVRSQECAAKLKNQTARRPLKMEALAPINRERGA